MLTATFRGGPFDGDVRIVEDCIEIELPLQGLGIDEESHQPVFFDAATHRYKREDQADGSVVFVWQGSL